MGSLKNAACELDEANSQEVQPVISWSPVSLERPVHIRPLKQGGVEIALYLREIPAPCEEVLWSRSAPGQLVGRVAAAIAAWFAESEVMPVGPQQDNSAIDTLPSSQTLGAGAQGSSATAAPVATSPVAPEGDENRGARAVKRAGILCKDPEFQRWRGIAEEYIGTEAAEVTTAGTIRYHCQIASRRDLAHDERARKAFEALMTEYDLWRGRIAEVRG